MVFGFDDNLVRFGTCVMAVQQQPVIESAAHSSRGRRSVGGQFRGRKVMLSATHVAVFVMTLVAPIQALVNAADATSPAASDDVLAFLVQGYSENRDKFRQLECHYRVTKGNVTSVEDALAGKLTNSRSMSGIWVVLGDWQHHELACDPRTEQPPKYDPARDPQRTLITSGGCDSIKVLTDGALGLSYSRGLEAASVAPSRGQRPPIFYTPISMSVMGDNEEWSPNAPLRPIAIGTMIRRYGGKVSSDGRELEAVIVGLEIEPQVVSGRHWLLDPQRGYLPVEMRYHQGDQLDGQTIATDVRQLENGGYFPFRTVNISREYANSIRSVVIVEVEKLVLGPPPESAFTVRLPPGTMITNPDTNRGDYTLDAATDVNVTQLLQLHARTDTSRTKEPPAENRDSKNLPVEIPQREHQPDIHPVVRTSQRGWMLLVASVVAVLLLALLFVFHRRSDPK